MICRTYTRKAAVFHMFYIAFLSVFGILTAFSAVFALANISCFEDRISAGFTIFFSMLIFSVDFFECRAMGARLYMNEDGIGVRRFGKTKVFINWQDIREIGTGRIPTPFGNKERVYLCDRHLNENEKSDLIILKYHTVHFSYIPKNWYQEMSERLPVQIPIEIKERYVR